jgi:hypothetical protein
VGGGQKEENKKPSEDCEFFQRLIKDGNNPLGFNRRHAARLSHPAAFIGEGGMRGGKKGRTKRNQK